MNRLEEKIIDKENRLREFFTEKQLEYFKNCVNQYRWKEREAWARLDFEATNPYRELKSMKYYINKFINDEEGLLR